MTSSVLVWDRVEAPPPDCGDVLFWRSYGDGAGTSVPRHLEDNAQRLRAAYLAFVRDLGKTRVSGRTVIEHLSLPDGFSLWWMTLVCEKNPFKSPGVYTCLRLLALEEMLEERKPAEVELAGSDGELARAVETLCRGRGIRFRRRGADAPPETIPSRGRLRGLPAPLRGALHFVRHLASRRSFRGFRAPSWSAAGDAVFFCSYFALLDEASCARGTFLSRQWGPLPGVLHAAGRRTNWLQHPIVGPEAPGSAAGLDWMSRFNADPKAQGAHAFLDYYSTWGAAWRAFKIWLGLNAAARRLRGLDDAALPGPGAWLWPLLRDDWRDSVAGTTAARNCLWVELFDAALRDLPHQSLGLYLCESLGWERAFLRAWRRNGHGRIVGVTHTTMPYWHLYNLNDTREWSETGPGSLPLPDQLAVNGPAARDVMTGAGYPPERLVDVEALRYLELPRPDPRRAADPERTRVLVLGDSLPAATRGLLTILAGARADLPPGWRFTFKAHPLTPVDVSRFPGLEDAQATAEPLGRILADFDVAVTANGTSAAVDAYQAGLPVVVGLNGGELNLSPLRGLPGARFAGTASEMSAALKAAAGAPAARPSGSEFFFLDPELPRWRRLLSVLIR